MDALKGGRQVSLTKNTGKYIIHSLIVIFFMFGFKYIPPLEPITEVGMGVLGVFLGVIWGWTFCSQVWPSILSLVAIGYTGYMTVTEAFSTGFGHDNVLLVFFILPMMYVLDQAGITKLFAYKILNLKIGRGRPWVLTFLIIYGTWVMSAFAGLFIAIFVAWSMFYRMCEIYDIPKGKYTTYMVAGICFACIMSAQAFPFSAPVLMMLGAYTGVSGITPDPLMFTIFMWITNFLYMVGYVLVGRFIIRPDVSAIARVDKDIIEGEGPLTTYQKIMIGFFVVFLLLMFWPSFMPADWFITQLISGLGVKGIPALLLAIILICNFSEAPSASEMVSKGVVWDVIFLMASVMVVANALGNEATGVAAFLNQVLQPIFGGRSTIVFLILVTLLPAVITNFCNNLVVGMIFIPIAYSFSMTAGINHTGLAVALCSLCSCAMITAAGCAPAAMLHGNTDWITTKEAAWYGLWCLIVTWIITFCCLPLAFMMF